MSLRILGGEFRNRLLKTPKGQQTRPTLAVMRKAVFDILQSKIQGAFFLDLFAGSGAMGLEALSWGAAHATFVESNRDAIRCIEENIHTLQVEKQATLMGYECILALKKLSREKRQFDIIYADPPYTTNTKILEEILLFVTEHTLLKSQGILFLEESAPPLLIPPSLQTLRYVNTRTFSRSALHQFQSKV